MIRLVVFVVFVIITFSCEQDVSSKVPLVSNLNTNFSDLQYVLSDSFPKGDIRRYGIFPNKPVDQNTFTKVLELVSKGLPITFPKGIYNTNIKIEGLKDVQLNFNDAIITGAILIIEKDSVPSQRIEFKGQLTVLDKLFIRKSKDITFNDVILHSDTLNNIYNKKNRGVSIYSGSRNISFKTLKINNTGGTEDSFFKYTAAALQIHGYDNNPEHITIKNLEITNSDRTALYITGNNHKLDKVSITNFGLGSSKNMFGLEDAKPGTEKEFTGAWLMKCNNVVIDSLEINQADKKGKYSLRFGEGKYHEPTFINHIKLSGYAKQLNIADHKLTNILVKDEYE